MSFGSVEWVFQLETLHVRVHLEATCSPLAEELTPDLPYHIL